MNKPTLTLLGLTALSLVACKKDEEFRVAGTINVVNMVSGTAVKVNTSGNTVDWATVTDQVNANANKFYYAPGGNIPIQVVEAADPTNVVFDKTIGINSAIYTMYLSGTADDVDTMFRQETNYPYIRTDVVTPDSALYIRFVNLAPDAPAMTVKLADSTNNMVTNLAYQGIGDWKRYSAKPGIGSYVFQIMDGDGDPILASPTFTYNVTNTNRFKNVTLVLRGNSTDGYNISAVNYF